MLVRDQETTPPKMRTTESESDIDDDTNSIGLSHRYDEIGLIKDGRWYGPRRSGIALAERWVAGYRMGSIALTANESANVASPQVLSTLFRYKQAAVPLNRALYHTFQAVTPLMGALNNTFRAGVPLPGTSKYVTFSSAGGRLGVLRKAVLYGINFPRCPPPLPPPEPYTTGQTQ